MSFAVVGGRILVGDGRVFENKTLIVSEGRIQKIVDQGEAVAETMETFDATGNAILPGLIDCHVHLCLDGAPDPLKAASEKSLPGLTLMASSMAARTLRAGVTTVRDLGGAGGVDLALRNSINVGEVPGPRMLASGKALCITGGHGWKMGREADGPDEFRKAAREQLKAGADIVKIISTGGVLTLGVDPGSPQATEEEQKAAVEEAHKAGRKTASHAQGTQGILNSLRAGIDSIEHGFFLDAECISIMADRQVAMVPTLAALGLIVEYGVDAGIPGPFVDKALRAQDAHFDSLRRAIEGGVPIVMGTDAGTPFNMHGANAGELVRFVRFGMSPMDALLTATSRAARLLGLEDEIGTLEEGKLADLLIVDGDPLRDIEILTRPEAILMVMKAGKPVVKSGC